MIDSDFHETQEFQPTMLALSHFVIQWNWAEHYFNVLLWQFVGGFETGPMYTAVLGNQSRTDVLLSISRKQEKNSAVLDLIEHAVSAFGKIKSNRNALVHAHSVHKYDANEKPCWVRASNNPRSVHIYCHADIEDIMENLQASINLASFLDKLGLYYMVRNSPGDLTPTPLPEKFPLPRTLVPIPVKIDEPSSQPQL